MNQLKRLHAYRPGIAYVLDTLYLAPTARSPAARTMRDSRGPGFAMRTGSGFLDANAYPSAQEPTANELASIVDAFYEAGLGGDLGSMGEKDRGVVFQGPGDPLEAVDVVLDTVATLSERRNGVAFRLNTMGLCDQSVLDKLLSSSAMCTNDEDRRRETIISTVSVFLPANDPRTYDELIQPQCDRGFADVCGFIAQLAEAGVNVECTAVDRPDVRVAEIEKLVLGLGARSFRTRPYFP